MARAPTSLPLEQVVGDAPNDLVCSICCGLAPCDGGASVTPCHHLFCFACIRTWLDGAGGRRPCPVCLASLRRGELRRLSEANPLLHRLLGKLKVMCPEEGCDWRGDYSGLAQHRAACAAAAGTCPDCGRALPRGQPRHEHAVACLRGQVERLTARNRQLEADLRVACSQAAAFEARAKEAEESAACAADSTVPPQPRAPRYGPHDRLALARLLGGCAGGEPPVGVGRNEAFNAVTSCVRDYERRYYDADEARELLLILLAAWSCDWMTQGQLLRIEQWVVEFGDGLLAAATEGR